MKPEFVVVHVVEVEVVVVAAVQVTCIGFQVLM